MDSVSPRDPSSATILHGVQGPRPSDLVLLLAALDREDLAADPELPHRLTRQVLADADHRRRAASDRLWEAYRQWGQHSTPYREAWEAWRRAYTIWQEVADIVGPVRDWEAPSPEEAPVVSAPCGAERFGAE
jgi:hypothetical protein